MAHAYLPIKVSEKTEEYDELHSIIPSGGERRVGDGRPHWKWGLACAVGGALVSVLIMLPLMVRNGTQVNVPVAHEEAAPEEGFFEKTIIPSNLIQYESRCFTTPVDFRVPGGEEFLVIQPGEIVYTGEPSPEIDMAWYNLLWGRYFSISEEEAKELWGEGYEMYRDHDKSGFTGGFDMFHQLHCLNQIRQALRRDYYPETKIHGQVHLDHCINHLRQAIQCWGNTAITPIKYFEGYHHGYVKSDVTHTCRKFEPIRQFVTDRNNGSIAVPRPDGKHRVENDQGW